MRIYRLDDMAMVVDQRGEIQTEILSNLAAARDDRQQLSRLKQVWRIAHDEYDCRSERCRLGWEETELDNPIDPELLKEAQGKFRQLYGWFPRSFDVYSESSTGRLLRECERRTNVSS